ncbi:bestrophin, RFP-TM, chloride channel family protein [Acinetobacter baumannii 348935]|uniref:bestrophin family protein n=1 Tax=Acinetobacter variabilis TaxID=70346 RepID=UPI0004450ECE|nr:bestrophin family protein [Acinetobacter variabilis]EXA64726.1 bestrophin, RFP-TM, chloride channel family protein [Acinetobacter baumannii 348935]MCU4630961.1 bestrophin family protein [Acinetobacter variabilis]
MIVRDKSNSFSLLFAWHGTILPKVLPALGLVIFLSGLLVYLRQAHFFSFPAVPAIGFTIFGVILSIFLSFRNTACYDRWWEGRKLWGALIATTRHLCRDSYVLDDQSRKILLYRMMLFTHLLRDRLRQQQQSIQHYQAHTGFEVAAFDQLPTHINASQWVLEQIQKDLVLLYKQGKITDIIYNNLNQHTVALGDIQAGCDRILSTPLPFSYSVLLHRAVYSFCFILPFSLEASLGLWTPILVGLIAYMLLGLDELSAELEEPFGFQDNDLPLDSIVRLIERETLSSLGQELPEAIKAQKAYLT